MTTSEADTIESGLALSYFGVQKARPDVSVIVPAYKCASTLLNTLRSIAQQQHVSVEAIIVDDDPDQNLRDILSTPDIVANNIYFILAERRHNGGQSTARNIGIRLSTAPYIAFLDSDDRFIDPDGLYALVRSARTHQLEIVRCNYLIRQTDTNNAIPSNYRETDENLVCNIYSRPQLVNISSCWQMLYDSEFLKRHAIEFSQRLRQREDRPFVLRALLRAQRVGFVRSPVIEYLVRPDSTMRTPDARQLSLYLIHLQEVCGYISSYNSSVATPPFSFLEANFALYIRAVFNYWNGVILGCYHYGTPAEQQLARDIFANLRQLALVSLRRRDDRFFLADSKALLSAQRNSFVSWNDKCEDPQLREYYVDLALLFLIHDRFDLFVSILNGEWPRFRDFLDLTEGHNIRRALVTAKYCSYRRDAVEILPPIPLRTRDDSSTKRMRIVLHLGMPKTGTSALQQYMALNRFQLWDRGVCYPLSGIQTETQPERRHRTAGHSAVLGEIVDGRKSRLFTRLLVELDDAYDRGCCCTFLSAEMVLSPLVWHGYAGLERIRRAFKFADLEVVAFRREPRAWAEAYYRERISNSLQ